MPLEVVERGDASITTFAARATGAMAPATSATVNTSDTLSALELEGVVGRPIDGFGCGGDGSSREDLRVGGARVTGEAIGGGGTGFATHDVLVGKNQLNLEVEGMVLFARRWTDYDEHLRGHRGFDG